MDQAGNWCGCVTFNKWSCFHCIWTYFDYRCWSQIFYMNIIFRDFMINFSIYYFSKQIGLESAKFRLISTATLDYDKNQYIFVSAASNNIPPLHKVIYTLKWSLLVFNWAWIWCSLCHGTSQIEAEVETYPEPDFTTAIIGGSLGGLAFLALLSAGLYKVR